VSYLLDTHVLLWGLMDDARLSKKARSILLDDDRALYFSAASAWEIAIKASLGRLRFSAPLEQYLPTRLATEGIEPLPISIAHAARTEALPWHHRDPFDRLLVAQAQIEGLDLLSSDRALRQYDVKVVW
jgi:PIN domain nuclease of toxin-antitoxin system